MKALYKTVLLCILAGMPGIANCQIAKAAPVIKLTDADSGKKLVIAKGQRFALTLPNHVDGGYRFDKPKYKTTLFRLIKHTAIALAANSRPGRPGHDVWQFIAISKGISKLQVTASRPWAGGGSVVLFSNIITVK